MKATEQYFNNYLLIFHTSNLVLFQVAHLHTHNVEVFKLMVEITFLLLFCGMEDEGELLVCVWGGEGVGGGFSCCTVIGGILYIHCTT